MDNLLQKLKNNKILFYVFFPIVVILAVLSILKSFNMSGAKKDMDETQSKSDSLKKEEDVLKNQADKLNSDAKALGKRADAIKEDKPLSKEDEVDEDWHKNRK